MLALFYSTGQKGSWGRCGFALRATDPNCNESQETSPPSSPRAVIPARKAPPTLFSAPETWPPRGSATMQMRPNFKPMNELLRVVRVLTWMSLRDRRVIKDDS